MKTILSILLVSFALASYSLADQPTLLATQAAEIAQTDLEERGLQNQVYIAIITYKKPSRIGSDPAHWEVLWSKAFPAQTEGRNEIGLKIKMDGSYSRSVR